MARRITIFFSWQSDSPRPTNHSFIEDCLERAIKELKRDDDLKVEPVLDRDTRGVPGSPDIVSTIFDKIRQSQVFVADVSIINPGGTGRPTPNPNVLIDLGYALSCLGDERVVCVCNEASGSIENLPFDLRQKRVCKYRLEPGQDKADPRKGLVAALREAIRLILDTPDPEVVAAEGRFFSRLASLLIDLLIFGAEAEERGINPWLDQSRALFGGSARELRELALEDAATRHALSGSLEELADACDEFATFRMYLGCGEEFDALLSAALGRASGIKAAHIDPLPVSADSLAEVRLAVVNASRQLRGLADRAERLAQQGRLDDLLCEPSQVGLVLLRLGHHDVDAIRKGLGERLREIGSDLHLVETARIVCDGGRSVQAIIDRVRQGREHLDALVQELGLLDSDAGA
jgi:hypothetical protein